MAEADRDWSDFSLWKVLSGTLALCPIFIAAARVFAISGGRSETMFALLQNMNIFSLVTTSLISPAVIVPLAAVIILVVLRAKSSADISLVSTGIAFVALVALPALGVRWWAWTALIAADLIGLAGRAMGPAVFKATMQNPTPLISAFVLGFTALVASRAQVPWLPAQVVHLNGGSTRTVYVISDSNDGLTVLEPDETVHFIAFVKIESREFCSDRRQDNASILKTTSESLPKCP